MRRAITVVGLGRGIGGVLRRASVSSPASRCDGVGKCAGGRERARNLRRALAALEARADRITARPGAESST